MSFCEFSNGVLTNGFTSVDNQFITSYMPFAKEEYTKVYLYGLFVCSTRADIKNVAEFAEELGVDIDTCKDAFRYWEEQNLISVASDDPLRIIYLPIKSTPVKKYAPGKFEEFNRQLQDLFPNRQLLQGEYLKYIDFITETKIEADALIMIVQYCINYKGIDVRYPYILAVARNWVNEGIKTVKAVEERIKDYELNNDIMREIAKTIGKKTAVEVEDRELYIKWTKSWGYELESILFAGTLQKNRGGFEKLDKTLDKFYKLGIFNKTDMMAYKENKKRLHALAVDVTSRLGLYYESLDYIIETYISKWLNMGFDDEAILSIADICFKSSIKSYEGMNTKVSFFYKNGRITRGAISEYLAELIDTDKEIKAVIETLGSSRIPNKSDRDYFGTWTNNWGFAPDVIMHVAKMCSTKSQSMAYLNNTLGRYYENKKFTISEIDASPIESGYSKNKNEYNINREFTAEELSGLFTSIDDLD